MITRRRHLNDHGSRVRSVIHPNPQHPHVSRTSRELAQALSKEAYNPYRFNSKRWDAGSGTYDMGFRDYSPGLNRFTSRDMYNGALADMGLGADPYTGNRYAFGGGNPTSFVELDGHMLAPLDSGGGGEEEDPW